MTSNLQIEDLLKVITPLDLDDISIRGAMFLVISNIVHSSQWYAQEPQPTFVDRKKMCHVILSEILKTITCQDVVNNSQLFNDQLAIMKMKYL